MSNAYYLCPLCGHEFALKSRQKTVKCGDHHLKVVEDNGVLTIQVVMSKTKPKENVSGGAQ